MTVKVLVRGITESRVLEPLHIFIMVAAFFRALDSCIDINRWGLGVGFQPYVVNLIFMVAGFAIFTILVSRSKVELIGYVFFCMAIYFICNYAIGGPLKFYLTPFDPVFGLEPAFSEGSTRLGLTSTSYRRGMAFCMCVLAASILAVSKLKRKP